VKDLSPEHLVKDNKGELWIRKNRQKTKIMCNIPVLPVAASILDKYKDVAECTGKLLPVLCNQRMNSYLKEIADVCGIHKNLSTHTARHSYRTLRVPCKWRKYGKCSQDVRSCRYQRDETLRTGIGSEYSKGYAESE